MSQRVLVIEDDASIARLLRDNLEYEGFTVECARDGDDGLRRVASFQPDLVLLDLMLPGTQGFDVCRALGAKPRRSAVIIITAKASRTAKIEGLNCGADDYVTKPFAFDELLARIRAVLRRSQPQTDTIELGGIVVDFRKFCAYKSGEKLDLRYREIELLRVLKERQGGVVTRDELLHLVWGYQNAPLTRTVDIFVARLRRKIEPDPHHPRFLKTVHGDGYCLLEP
jgi:DNA-binding response OmpR family regulator